ncbi:MAG: ATP-binding protein [Acidobacteriaceae bacterium]
MPYNEADLLRLLSSCETTFVERKSMGDAQDWVKTVVAFANTLIPEQEGILFLGVTDKGDIQNHNTDLDSLQKKFVEKTRVIYPECPYYRTQELGKDGRSCLAIVIPGGTRKPYFAGPPYFRVASTAHAATPEQFEQLLATRSDKAYFLHQWIDRAITIRIFSRIEGVAYRMDKHEGDAKLLACNGFYVTVSLNNGKWSYPLTRVNIAFDHRKDRLEIEILPQPS